MGLYFLEYGAAPRPVRVLYDRRDSALSRLVPEEVDWGLVRARAHGPPLRDHPGPRPELAGRASPGVRRGRGRRGDDLARRQLSLAPVERRRRRGPSSSRSSRRLHYLFIGADDAATVFDLAGSPEETLGALRALAPRATIALTLGEAGSAVRAGEVTVRPSKLYDVTVVDRVGAGDAYAAGFLWATLEGRSLAGGGGCRHRARRAQVHDLGRRARRDPPRAGGADGHRQHGDPPLRSGR